MVCGSLEIYFSSTGHALGRYYLGYVDCFEGRRKVLLFFGEDEKKSAYGWVYPLETQGGYTEDRACALVAREEQELRARAGGGGVNVRNYRKWTVCGARRNNTTPTVVCIHHVASYNVDVYIDCTARDADLQERIGNLPGTSAEEADERTICGKTCKHDNHVQ